MQWIVIRFRAKVQDTRNTQWIMSLQKTFPDRENLIYDLWERIGSFAIGIFLNKNRKVEIKLPEGREFRWTLLFRNSFITLRAPTILIKGSDDV